MMHIVLRWLQQQSYSQLDGDATFDHCKAYSQHNQSSYKSENFIKLWLNRCIHKRGLRYDNQCDVSWPNVGCHKLLLNLYPINGISNTPTNTACKETSIR